MIGGSLAVTAGAAVIGVVFSLGLAVVLTQFAPPGLTAALKPAIELLAGIPSVVYGFVGVVTLVPLIRHLLGGPGLSVLAASIVLGIMILPTITSIATRCLAGGATVLRRGLDCSGRHAVADRHHGPFASSAVRSRGRRDPRNGSGHRERRWP